LPALIDLLPISWRNVIPDSDGILQEIEKKISPDHASGAEILPSPDLIFSTLEIDPSSVSVVIVGQDPYPDADYAIGRAFAVRKETSKIPASLRNILKEREIDVGGQTPDLDLQQWHDQGVLLLNRTLTVRAGESNSHKDYGWEFFTREIMSYLASKGVPALLWGAEAQKFQKYFGKNAVMSAHPSPLSAYRGFFGSQPFSRVNKILEKPIKW
jgi:uracil-DNA glycosylase